MNQSSDDITKVVYDEMYSAPNEPRAQYRAVFDRIYTMPREELILRQQAADQSFLHQGITFTVYRQEEGT